MKIINNILTLLVALVIFVSGNGFILEQYLCFDCDTKHNEIAFFEFGELKHNHNACSECANHGHVCDCSKKHDEHAENADVTYYTLETLYSNNSKIDFEKFVVFNYIKDLSIDLFNNLNLIINNSKIIILKIPPLTLQTKSSVETCSIFSIFRL